VKEAVNILYCMIRRAGRKMKHEVKFTKSQTTGMMRNVTGRKKETNK
jgi:hypothetical protein